MSSVTNLILTLSCLETDQEVASFLNSYPNEGKGFCIVCIDDPSLPKGWYGGTKYMEAAIYLGAYNRFNYASFIDYLKEFPWQYPEEVQVLVKGEWDDQFKVFTLD